MNSPMPLSERLRRLAAADLSGATTRRLIQLDMAEAADMIDTLRRQLAEAEALLNTPQEPLFSYRHFKERAEAAEAKLALAEQYARRYRFLRDIAWHSEHRVLMEPRQHLDAAIDAAIAAGEGKGD